jgi:hypothetical protein
LSISELDERIGRAREELAELQRVRKAKAGGMAAAATPRPRRFSDDEVWTTYERFVGESGREYRAIKATAARLGISTRTVHRSIARSKPRQLSWPHR